MPLTTAALDGVDPEDAGAASGLVNVMQQVGGSLGLAVLVTVFGAASRSRGARRAAGRDGRPSWPGTRSWSAPTAPSWRRRCSSRSP